MLTPMLFDVLLRFCVWNIGVMVDIEKAYLQIVVSPTERDYLRFLWYDVTKKDLDWCMLKNMPKSTRILLLKY